MRPISSAAVRFCLGSETDLDYQSQFLEYLSNLYELIASFPIERKAQAQDLWCELTDRSSRVCLLVQEEDAYSVWGLTERDITLADRTVESSASNSSQRILAVMHWLGFSLRLVIADLAGAERARAFVADLRQSSLPIATAMEIDSAPDSALIWAELRAQSITPTQVAALRPAIEELQRLVAKYVGRNCARQVLQDLTAQLSLPESIAL